MATRAERSHALRQRLPTVHMVPMHRVGSTSSQQQRAGPRACDKHRIIGCGDELGLRRSKRNRFGCGMSGDFSSSPLGQYDFVCMCVDSHVAHDGFVGPLVCSAQQIGVKIGVSWTRSGAFWDCPCLRHLAGTALHHQQLDGSHCWVPWICLEMLCAFGVSFIPCLHATCV